MLEINARPGRDLRALLERIGESRLLRELNIHRTTLRRWLNAEVTIPGRQHLAIKLLLGDLPGTEGRWTGWGFVQGELVSPGGDRYRPGDVLSLIILRQQLTAQRREVEELRVKLAIAEEAVDRLAPAANDSRAFA
tara:strand:+ start:532 stop:939 length:408 start_codon:yes stop_codon:yes gene_type:complete